MRFKEFFIINELFGNFNYKLPEDKEQQLYDFYMLSFIKGRSSLDNKKQEIEDGWGRNSQTYNPDPTNFDQEDQQDFMLKEVVLTLIPALKRNLLDAVFYSLSAEIRHIFDQVNESRVQILNKVQDKLGEDYAAIFKKYVAKYTVFRSEPVFFRHGKQSLNKLDAMKEKETRNKGYQASFSALLKTGESEEKLVKLMKYLYENLEWSSSYGGQAWGNIANGWLKLYQAKTEGENFIYIDHIYDLQHNTDTVFNKLSSYMKNDSYNWIKRALDHKRDIKEPHDIIDLVSPTMRRLALRVIKMKFGKTYEDFLKEKEERKNAIKVKNNEISIKAKAERQAKNLKNVYSHPSIDGIPLSITMEVLANEDGTLKLPMNSLTFREEIEKYVKKELSNKYSVFDIWYDNTPITELGLYTVNISYKNEDFNKNPIKKELKVWVVPADEINNLFKVSNSISTDSKLLKIARNFLGSTYKPTDEKISKYIKINFAKISDFLTANEIIVKIDGLWEHEKYLIEQFKLLPSTSWGISPQLTKEKASKIYKKTKPSKPYIENKILFKIKQHLGAWEKIPAIKEFRVETNWPLHPSKNFIEYLQLEMIANGELKTEAELNDIYAKLFQIDFKDLDSKWLTIARNFLKSNFKPTDPEIVNFIKNNQNKIDPNMSVMEISWKINDLYAHEKNQMKYIMKINTPTSNQLENMTKEQALNLFKKIGFIEIPYIRSDVLQNIMKLCQGFVQGGIIPAIKEFRDYSKWGLAECKKFIEYQILRMIASGEIITPTEMNHQNKGTLGVGVKPHLSVKPYPPFNQK